MFITCYNNILLYYFIDVPIDDCVLNYGDNNIKNKLCNGGCEEGRLATTEDRQDSGPGFLFNLYIGKALDNKAWKCLYVGGLLNNKYYNEYIAVVCMCKFILVCVVGIKWYKFFVVFF